MDALEQLHKDSVIGSFDVAVIDKKDGKPHVAKRLDRPQVRIVPEWFGGGALPRKELHQAAEELTASQAGLIAVGEPTIEKALDRALTGAAKWRSTRWTPRPMKSRASCRMRSKDRNRP